MGGAPSGPVARQQSNLRRGLAYAGWFVLEEDR
jgi:hypothetical protein